MQPPCWLNYFPGEKAHLHLLEPVSPVSIGASELLSQSKLRDNFRDGEEREENERKYVRLASDAHESVLWRTLSKALTT